MLNRISISVLLKLVIVTMAASAMITVSISAWDSWTRLAAVKRITAVAETSSYLFTALHNLRVDRASTYRDLNSDKPVMQMTPLLKHSRDGEMPALKSGLAALEATDFAGRDSAVSRLRQAITNLTALHEEANAASAQPKSARPQGLAQKYFKETDDLIKLLDTISSHLTQSVKLQDAYIDQLMELKELAWVARNAGGDASVMISNALGGVPLPADAMVKYTTNVSRLDTAWSALENLASGLPLPPRFNEAIEKAQKAYFGRDYVDLRLKTLKALIAHEPVSVTVSDWSPLSVGKLASLLHVAEVAIDVAKDHAAAQHAEVLRALGFQIGMLIAAMALACAMVLLISRRVTGPLGQISGALIELTNDRIADVPYTNRSDEIGEIAKATEVFKQSIAQKVINLRVRSALDVVRSNVMVADGDYNIMYMNTTLQEMMQEAEPEIRKALPNFTASKLLGANMDVFHKNPAHQRQLLDSLTSTHESRIAIGTQKFHLVATPVVDQHGKRSGTVVEWRNETVEKAIEAEVDGLVKAAVAGDFSQRVPLEGKKEFMLNLATSMNALCENTGKALDDLAGMMSALADGDMTQRITAEYQGMFGKLKTDANMMAERIGSTVAEIKASATEVTSASAEISASTTDLSQRTEEQAASLEQTSASMEEIASTVKNNAENAQQANASASATRDVADRGGQVVAQAVQAMAGIEESSRKISDIIGVIDEIARQTNLLALNAAVEAARAGEAGRGFAVVASEVRSLAQRSSQAAKDIKDLITNSNDQVKGGVELVNRAGTALTEIVESIKKVADIVADIASASNEQSTGIEQVNKALTQMDEVTQQNSALVEENAATAKTLEHQAKAMAERVSFFKLHAVAEDRPAAKHAAQPAAARAPRPAAAPPSRGPAAGKQPAAPKQQPAAHPSGPPRQRMLAGRFAACRPRSQPRSTRAGLERVLADTTSRRDAMRPFGTATRIP